MILRLIITFISIALLCSCNSNNNQSNLQKYLADLKNNKQQADHSNHPSIALPQRITYQGQSLRSPFDVNAVVTNTKNSILNPLKAYSLSMLRFVGTIKQDDITYAYILSPDNKFHQIKVGDFIGEHDGTVEHIYSNRIEIKEKQLNENKQPAYKIVNMQLKDKNND